MFRSSKHSTQKRTRAARQGKLLLSALTAAALGAGFCPAARAAGYVYQQHTLNAGVLVNGSDPAPYLFYVLNNRPDVRPTDLNFINPLAPAGASPTAAAYWEVSLNNVSDSEMAQYDVLYLPAGGVTFGPAVNEKLRRFVDNGGQLIVEYETAVPNPTPPPTVTGLLFTGTGATGTPASAALPSPGTVFLRHPIISQPYLLSDTDVSGLTIQSTAATVPPTTPAGYITPNGSDLVHHGEYSSIFSPVLSNSTGTIAAAAQIGAGQVVVTTLSLGLGISVDPYFRIPATTGPLTFNPANLYVASTPDLKLLANIITWSETHPNENKTSHGNASSAGLASFSPAWQYLPMTAGTNPPPGAAVWGNFVFAVDATGVLRAFDAYPPENLTGNANPAGAEQVTTGLSLYPMTSYDEIWNTSRFNSSLVGASAPTVASFGGVNYVFVEKQDGTLVALNAVTGASAPFMLKTPPSGGTFTTNAPAPTFYDGRLYAGQSNGTMHVYDLNEGTSAVVTLDPSTQAAGTSEPVTAAPSVGTLADGDTNVLVAVVPTTLNVYTVLLGGRNEPLSTFMVNGSLAGYHIDRTGRYYLGNIFADVNAATVPALLAYDYNGNVSNTPAGNTAPSQQDPLFAITNNAGYYTDWNMDFGNATGTSTGSTTPNQVNLNFISASNYDQRNTPVPAMLMSAPAIDRHGSYYYTETITTGGTTGNYTNSYLVGVTNASLYSHVRLKFRFRLPTTADASTWGPIPYVDADGVNYNDTNDNASLIGYHFVGAPVVDDQGNVYAAAIKGANATVLCLRGNQPVSAVAPAGSAINTTTDAITQADEGGGTENRISRGDDTERFGQFIPSMPVASAAGTDTTSGVQFFNFGLQGLTQQQIVGNVTEPQPLSDTTNTPATTLSMQTNLAWFVKPFPVIAASSSTNSSSTNPIAGLTQVGSSLLLTDGADLYRLSTNPQIGASKLVTTPPSVTPLGVSAGSGTATGVGAVASVPSVGGSVMVINGTNGIAARTRQVTVIADNNRILGVDGDGSAVWAVDATTRTDTTVTPSVSTKVPFSRPTALSQFALNDYLVADTGSNRCVRFDTGGNVKWELTRFQDPYGLMASGQSLTLSQPSSVITRPPFVLPTNDPLYPSGTATPYLVADSGNDRVLEVSDIVDTAGALHSHVLTWASHTGDRYGRSYRYGSAAYYVNLSTPSHLSIAATVTNTRLAPLAVNATTNVVTGLGSVSGDAPGGSLVVFNYPQTPVFYSNQANAPVDLVYTTAGFYAAVPSSGGNPTYTPFTIRNPRFLQLASSLTASAPVNPNFNPVNPNNVPAFDFLYADDNGAFDLSYDTNKQAFVAGADRLQFKTTDYHGMTYPVAGSATPLPVPAYGVSDTTATTTSTGTTISYTNLRQNLPFVPTCVQAISTDSQPITSTTGILTRRYLITQNYSQGELGSVNSTTTGAAPNTTVTNIGKIGGEIFEVDVSAPVQFPAVVTAGTTPPPVVTGAPTVTTPGGFGGNSTLSHPALTGPLTQPTYAVRLP